MNTSLSEEKSSRYATRIILAFAAAEVLLHLFTNAFVHYGYFRDELYYIACSRHLAAGYVDQPPLASFILFISIKLFGDSIFAIRLLPALASGVTIYLAGLITRKLKGGPFAVALACLSLAIAPEFLGTNGIYSMNGFDWVFWSLGAYIVALIMESEQPGARTRRLWLLLGVVLGFGLLNKIDILWFGFSLLVGLLLTPQRNFLKTIWPYIAGIIALVIFSPYVIWNMTHNFATLEFIHNASTIKYASQNPLTFTSDTILSMNPLALPVWLAGIYFFFFSKDGKKYRLLGYIFLVSFLVLVLNWHSKAEYIAPAFPILFAAGGVMFERIASRRYFGWTRFAMPALVAVFGLILLPLALPVLPVQTFVKYSSALGITPSSGEAHKLTSLPQYYADMFGWRNMAATVSRVYVSLPPDEREKTVVFAQNYGEAGAIDFFRSEFPLPTVICGHNNYWYWSSGDSTFTTIIVIGGTMKGNLEVCDSVSEAAVIRSKYAMPYESNLPVFICRGFKMPFAEIWQRVKSFI